MPIDVHRERRRRVSKARDLLDVLTRSEADRAALIGRLSLRAGSEWLAELQIDLEEDEPARLGLFAALRGLQPKAGSRLPQGRQRSRGGFNVIGILLGPPHQVWIAEVAAHLGGLDAKYAARARLRMRLFGVDQPFVA
jgi:hypothetical protein